MRTTTMIITAAVAALLILGAGLAAYQFLGVGNPVVAEAAQPGTGPRPAGSQPAAKPPSSTSREASSASAEATAPAKPKASIMNGTAGDDALKGSDGDDRIYAAEDTDPQGSDTIDAGAGDDRIYADAGDKVQGGAGHDQLIVRGAAGFQLVLAGTGIEESWGGDGDDVFDGTGIKDEPLTLRGGEGKDRLTGGEMDDMLFGGAGDDVLIGAAGDDTLKGEAGTDTLTGGPGADFFSYAKFDGSTDIVTDYNFAEGDTVSAASFAVHGADTWLLDADGNTLFVLKNYDAKTAGVARRR